MSSTGNVTSILVVLSYGILTHRYFNSWYDSGEDSEFDEDDFMSDNSSQE